VLGPRTTGVHNTHLTDEDIALLGTSRTGTCMCPTTERDLADGIVAAAALIEAGARLCLGSDSNAVIDLFEEARGVELDERLATGDRGRHRAADLLRAATSGGADALGWPDTGRLEPGARADLVTVRLDSVRLAGTPSDQVVGSLVFAATASDVHHVVVGGETVVRDGRHVTIDVAAELAAAIGALAP
jgi:cytosine/adenosine deaminase-related metal-dependent hydrolase